MSGNYKDVREDRRKAKVVLKELRLHQQEVEEDKEDAIDCRSEALTQHFKRSEHNLGKSQTVDQALLDAQIFHQLGQYSKRQADQLQSGLQTFDVKTFAESLTVLMQRSRAADRETPDVTDLTMNLADLGKGIFMRWKTIPSIDFMHGNAPSAGPIRVGERKKLSRVKKGVVAKKPSELSTQDVEQTETDKQVKEMKIELQRRGKCNFWIFVIDPHSFTRSVENVFHSSFLIKDMYASLDLKREENPTIKYCEPRERGQGGGASEEGDMQTSQFILGFDKRVWLEVVEKFNIRKCIFPAKSLDERDDEQLRRLKAMERAVEEEGYEDEEEEQGTARF